MALDESTNPLTLGFYNTPEQHKPIKLVEVKGTIPAWLEGSLYRGAPGIYDVGQYTSEHWFDAFSRVYRFEISNGQVTYRSRNITDEMVAFIEETGRYPGAAFCQDPCKILLGALESTWRDGKKLGDFSSSKNFGVNYVLNWPGKGQIGTGDPRYRNLIATTDANDLLSLDVETMEPFELFSYEAYEDSLYREGLSSAHPTYGADGSIYNQVTVPTEDGGAEYKVFEISPLGESRVLASITDAPASYIHHVSGTENFVVLVVWQAYLDWEKIGQSGSVLGGLRPWDEASDTLFYVIDKKQGGVEAKYTAEALYTFHGIAAYEDPTDGSIVIDLPLVKNHDFLNAARVPNLRANVGRLNGNASHDLAGTFKRYRLANVRQGPHDKAIIDFEFPFDEFNTELPRQNQAYYAKPYRYAYGVHVTRRGYLADSLIKIDTERRTSHVYRPDNDSICSEPVSIASPKAASEDDGILLSIATDSTECKSYMVIIDVKSMQEIARARYVQLLSAHKFRY